MLARHRWWHLVTSRYYQNTIQEVIGILIIIFREVRCIREHPKYVMYMVHSWLTNRRVHSVSSPYIKSIIIIINLHNVATKLGILKCLFQSTRSPFRTCKGYWSWIPQTNCQSRRTLSTMLYSSVSMRTFPLTDYRVVFIRKNFRHNEWNLSIEDVETVSENH